MLISQNRTKGLADPFCKVKYQKGKWLYQPWIPRQSECDRSSSCSFGWLWCLRTAQRLPGWFPPWRFLAGRRRTQSYTLGVALLWKEVEDLASQRNTGVLFFIDWLFTTFTGQKLGLQSLLQPVEQSIFIPTYIPQPMPAPYLTPWQSRFLVLSPPPPNLYFSSSFLHRVAMHVREKDNTC